MYIEFKVRCEACNQTLNPTHTEEGVVEYSHGNDDDCSEGSITLPAITPEQLGGLFKTKKAPAKKASKKRAK